MYIRTAVICDKEKIIVGLTFEIYLVVVVVLLEKLTVPQLEKKFPAFYKTHRFTAMLTRAFHLSLS